MTSFINQLNQNLRQSADMLAKSALAIPADKLDWNPGGKARTTIDILLECAAFPQWIMTSVEKGAMPTTEEASAMKKTLVGEAKTIEILVDILRKETESLCQFVSKFPEARLSEQMTFPWGAYSIAGVFDFHYWNNTYHLGQINYLQLILGDTDMHM